MIDEGTEFAASVARRLGEEMAVWLTTMTPAGAPRPFGHRARDADAAAADANPASLDKYASRIEQLGMTPATYPARFNVPVRSG